MTSRNLHQSAEAEALRAQIRAALEERSPLAPPLGGKDLLRRLELPLSRLRAVQRFLRQVRSTPGIPNPRVEREPL